MITDKDIEKLKKVFATKDDLKRFATKDDLKRFVTKEYLDGALDHALSNYPTRNEMHQYFQEATQSIIKEFHVLLEMFSELKTSVDHTNAELQANRIVLGNHEGRLQNLEQKSFVGA